MEAIVTKKCTKCGELRVTSQYVKDSTKKDGLYPSCKQCGKASYLEKLEWHRARSNAYQKKNRDRVISKKKEYRIKNRATLLQRLAEYHRTNKEAEAEYRKANRERLNAVSAKWASENKDKRNKALREWRVGHPEKVHIQKSNRYSREKVAAGRITKEDWDSILARYGNKCLCCGRSDVRITIDHIVPLALGGRHEINNLQPLCKSCNSRKGARNSTDYR